MDHNRLSKTLAAALNEQMTKEAHAAQIYLSYGVWADGQGYSGVATFLFRHAEEERDHMMKILEYIMNRGAQVLVSAIPAPPVDPVNINSCFEKIFEHEVDNTKSIYKIERMCFDEEDWATWNFLQWFVKEQIEEETLARKMMDKLKIAGGEKADSRALYSMDRDMANDSGTIRAAQDITAANP